MLAEQVLQRIRAELLFALHEDHDSHGQVVAVRPQGRDVRQYPRLVVGAAAPEQPPVDLGRLEGRGTPLARVAHRLDVVVGVQQHGRRSGRGRAATEHGRLTGAADDAYVRHPGTT